MKQTLFAAFFALAALTATTVSAQSMNRSAEAAPAGIFTSNGSEVATLRAEAPAPSVSAKVLSAFSKNFKGTAANWFTAGDNYLARFTKDGRATHALYKKNGNMLYSVTKGSADLLPNAAREVISAVYRDYDITAVAKATSLGTTAFIAHLNLGHSLIVIKVIDNEIVEETRYRTSAK